MSRSLELIPNSFQVPNFLVDKLLPHLSARGWLNALLL
jgi:hypothetical protein